jgi:glycosyltransferase involved in cell wall biosynthesis
MNFIQRLQKAKVVFIAFTFNPSGGSCVSANHYYNYCTERGILVEKVSRDARFGLLKIMAATFFARKLVFNGLYCFYFYEMLILCLLRKDSIIYLHESEYALNDFKTYSPLKYKLAKYIFKTHKIACISTIQQNYIKETFSSSKTYLVYNTLPFVKHFAFNNNDIKILMAGYIMPRKGVELFSKLADYARERGESWSFYWLGSGNYPDLYYSKNVNWLGYQANPHYYYEKIDVFFLASVDEPFGLVCAEALMHKKRCVVYKNAGYAELIKDISGCSTYKEYTVPAAYEAIKSALSQKLDVDKVEKMLLSSISVESFMQKFDKVLSD